MIATALCHLVMMASTPAAPESPPKPENPVGWFVGHSVRVLSRFGTASPAMSTEFGARLPYLSLGVSALYKPANWGPARFNVTVPNGETYKGKASVRVGAQYGVVGLYAAPEVPIDRSRRFAIEFPLTVGLGFLGTPMLGEDRKTPDGRRVSEWENELTEGDDVNFAFAGEVGARLRFAPVKRVSWFHLVAGVHYTFFSGYESSVVSDASLPNGVSGSIGVVFGPTAARRGL